MSVVRTIVVIHNRIFRDGICSYLDGRDNVQIAAVLDNIEPLSDRVAEIRPDLVLIDLELPDGNAIEGIRRVVAAKPDAWIIGLAVDEERDYCDFAIRAGAATVIAKDLVGKMLAPLLSDGAPSNRAEYERPSVIELRPRTAES